MTNDIIDSTGRFWLSSIDLPKGHFAPDQSVTGRLRLHSNGQSDLDLDGTLGPDGIADAVRSMFTREAPAEAVCGFLFDANKYVRLSDLSGNGGKFGGAGPGRVSLVALRCLVSHEPFQSNREPTFRWVDLPLKGYEEWVGTGNIDVRYGRRHTIARSPTHAKITRWPAANMTIELRREISRNIGTALNELMWQERIFMRIGFPRSGMTVESAIDLHQRLEDLLVLMADHNRRLEFSTVRATKKSKPVQLYFARSGRETDRKANWRSVWVSLRQCERNFGELVQTWLSKYSSYGPGFHLYLGNRRGQTMYAEHRFASLMWGLEALHRTMIPLSANTRQAAKVERILTQITDEKDRKWARGFLPANSEPSLANRLLELFSRLDLGISKAELTSFSQLCARRRNDVSHFGGQREIGDYTIFLADISKLSEVVDLLYHAVILYIIGIPPHLLRNIFLSGPNSYSTKILFESCDLHITT